LNTSRYREDGGGPVPFIKATDIEGDFLDVPDSYINALLVVNRGYGIVFLPGITVNHQRVADSTLPIA